MINIVVFTEIAVAQILPKIIDSQMERAGNLDLEHKQYVLKEKVINLQDNPKIVNIVVINLKDQCSVTKRISRYQRIQK